MIKLVASDLDGTLLLDGAQTLSPDIIPIIKELKEKGILFVAASGRQYSNLRRLFAPVADDIGYICENGAIVKYKGETLFKSAIPRDLALEVVQAIMAQDNCEGLISGEDTTYIVPKTQFYRHHICEEVKNNVSVLTDFNEIAEDMVKVSVCDFNGIEQNHAAQKLRQQYGDRLYHTVSGLAWQDFLAKGTNKGTGMKVLCESLGIAPEEVMAFGDNYNDLEMLEYVGVPVAMNNSPDALKKLATMTCDRVEDMLREYFNL
jgi:Cof subfamily protein (haloacid dehalogenase superfamily)